MRVGLRGHPPNEGQGGCEVKSGTLTASRERRRVRPAACSAGLRWDLHDVAVCDRAASLRAEAAAKPRADDGSASLATDSDGSIAITIQSDDPGEELRSNWLPAPAGSFNLTMRLYGARASILDGTYHLPGVTRLG